MSNAINYMIYKSYNCRYLIKGQRIKTIVIDNEDASKRRLLLSTTIDREHLPDPLKALTEERGLDVVPHELIVGYEQMGYGEDRDFNNRGCCFVH